MQATTGTPEGKACWEKRKGPAMALGLPHTQGLPPKPLPSCRSQIPGPQTSRGNHTGQDVASEGRPRFALSVSGVFIPAGPAPVATCYLHLE